MALRSDLQQIFEAICDNVYFQPPASVQMAYPAIVYQRGTAETRYADNNPYRFTKQYEVTLVSRDPDDSILDQLAQLHMSRHDRHYVAENLNHDVFTIYF